MRMKTMLRLGGSVVLASSLAACGGGGNDRDNPPPPTATPSPTPPPVAGTFQSMFGSAFAAIFNAPATGEPVDPTASSVPPLAPASDPLDNGVT